MNRKYRKTVIAGNWKMNKTPSETKEYMTQLKAIMPKGRWCDVCLCVPAVDIPADQMGLDIGPKAAAEFAAAAKAAKTVVWNGPMGVFENPTLAKGTIAVAQALADSDAVTIVGGGDSAAACEQLGFADKITHISTGGGASLEFLEGLELPGIACLQDK